MQRIQTSYKCGATSLTKSISFQIEECEAHFIYYQSPVTARYFDTYNGDIGISYQLC